jgi:hypothetical protein
MVSPRVSTAGVTIGGDLDVHGSSSSRLGGQEAPPPFQLAVDGQAAHPPLSRGHLEQEGSTHRLLQGPSP